MKKFTNKNNRSLSLQYALAIGGIALLILLGSYYNSVNKESIEDAETEDEAISLEEQVLSKDGITLPISWGNLGSQMIEVGVIDAPRFEAIYTSRGGFSEEDKKLVYGNNEEIIMTRENAGLLLNLFWAFGLSNENVVLEEGEMTDKRYGGDAGQFASTGGWSLSVDHPMNHYSKHTFVSLTKKQQQKVENVAKGIYRPCCGNSTYFPDCNHGMAMLGLLELMAAEEMSEEDMFEVALQVNSYWFPETYLTLATYFESQGTLWNEVNPKVALSEEYSSARGYQRVLQELKPVDFQGGSGCSV